MKFEAEAITRKPFEFKIGEESIFIKPITVRQMIEINPLLMLIKKEDWDNMEKDIQKSDISYTLKYMSKYLVVMNKVINIIVGKDISDKITPDDMLLLFLATYKRIQNTSFLKSIILIQKLSLQTRSGIIAASTILKN